MHTGKKILFLRTQHLGFPTPSVFKQIAIFSNNILTAAGQRIKADHDMKWQALVLHSTKPREQNAGLQFWKKLSWN